MSRPREGRPTIGFEAIGTVWSIETASALDPSTRARIDALLERYDRTWSRFRPDSPVTRLAAEGGEADFGDEAPPLLDLLLDLERRTGGAMTPLVGGSLAHLGYDATYGLRPRAGYLPAPSIGILHREGTRIRLREPATIDVGSAGKGQLIDLVATVLEQAGHADFAVDGGRDLRIAGQGTDVALEHPYDPSLAVGVLHVRDASLCASAVNLRSWDSNDGRGRLHHVLDGRTGRPVDRIAATWVLAADAMTADALSTALFFVRPEALEDAYMFDSVTMYTDGRVIASRDLPGELFL